MMIVAVGLVALQPAGQLQEAGVDALAYRLQLKLAPDPSTFSATAEIVLRVEANGLQRISLDLGDLDVDYVRVNAARAPFTHKAGKLEIDLATPRQTGDRLVVEVIYRGAPVDGLKFGNDPYGRPTVFADNWPNRAHHWFPSIDHPSDKATVELRVRAPRDWQVIGNGLRIAEADLADGSRLTVWATERPIPVYTMVVGAGAMAIRRVGALGCVGAEDRCVRINQWSFAEDVERASRLFRRAPEMLAFYDSLIGPFFYEKLALVQSTTQFGGMENSSAIFFSEDLSEGMAGDVLVAHEIVHQWFGDAVTEREWAHLWLSEGFATYFANVFFELVDGEAVARPLMAAGEDRYRNSLEDVERPVIDTSVTDLMDLLNRNNYQKGAWVLHMLRRVIGDEAFFEGIRRYYAEFRDKTALTADFRRMMEDASGQKLSWFFDQWLRRPGYPQVELHTAWESETKNLELSLSQTQSWPHFRFPLEVQVSGDAYVLVSTFWVDSRESSHTWQLPGEPQAIVVDPDNDLLGPTVSVKSNQ